MKRTGWIALLATIALTSFARAAENSEEMGWPQFRGPNASGIGVGNPPVHFGPGRNVQWKTPVGAGISSPIVWENRIFLTEFDAATRKLATIGLDRRTGRILWRREVTPQQIEEVHELSSPAAATPVTDGERVYVYFGSYGLVCYDLEGNEKWEMRLPLPQNYYGASASPIVAGEFLVLNHQGKDSYLLAVHRRDGRIAWKTGRSLFQFGWSTPVHWRRDGTDEILVQGGDFKPNQRVMAYDLATGAERWWVGGLPACGKSTPVVGGGVLFLAASDIIMEPSAEKRNPDGAARFYANNAARIMAVRPGATGEIAEENIIWSERKGVPGVPSLLYYNGRLYSFKDGGLVFCRDAKTGSLLYNERLGAPGYYYSSPVAADGKIYIASAQGVVVVLEEGATFKILATNKLDGAILATPALVGPNIYVRTEGHLYAFEKTSDQTFPAQSPLTYEVRQLTFGPSNHFYGYIGHVGNSPYSRDGKSLIALRTTFQDRMPGPDDAADLVLLDATRDYAEAKLDQTRGWNPQQGAMIYWNPEQPNTQFFFNDRDPKTGKVFTALYDISQRKRIKEFKFDAAPAANGGVRQDGGAFAAINYARMARLRPVTGYPGAWDWTERVNHPKDDGLFIVDVKTGDPKLIVSFEQMRDALLARHPTIAEKALFLNHTLWNREGDRIFFFVRADFDDSKRRINVPMTVRPDGSELTEQRVFIGGHPEWDFNSRMLGAVDRKLVLYDTSSQQIIETIGGPEIFRDAEGDTALSSDGKWLVNGATTGPTMHYTVLRRADRAILRTEEFSRGTYTRGDLRIDPAPCWNRAGDRFAFPALARDGTRQMFEVRVFEKAASNTK